MPRIIVVFHPRLGEEPAEDGHRRDLGDLADAHHGHDPLGRDAHCLTAKEAAGHEEVAVVDRRVDEGDDEEHEQEGLAQELRRFDARRIHLRQQRQALAGVCGRLRLKTASTSEATPEMRKMFRLAATASTPVLP
jgi:hypothetical protein